jgi:hypothetical protein
LRFDHPGGCSLQKLPRAKPSRQQPHLHHIASGKPLTPIGFPLISQMWFHRVLQTNGNVHCINKIVLEFPHISIDITAWHEKDRFLAGVIDN